MEHFGYLFAAYSIIFVVIFIYVVFIWRRQVALDAELGRLEAALRALAEKKAENGAEVREDSPAQL
jgi:CcmD family protein